MTAAPIETRAAVTHKKGTASPSSLANLASSWHPPIISWYAGSAKPNLAIMRIARDHGISDFPPESPRDRVRALALAGFDVEEAIAAVPSLNPVDVAEIIDRIPGEVRSIYDLHLAGQTPVEISRETGVSRPKVYWWLRRFGLTPNRRARHELTTRQRTQIVRAYGTGEPMASIASRFGVSYDQVRYAVKVEIERIGDGS